MLPPVTDSSSRTNVTIGNCTVLMETFHQVEIRTISMCKQGGALPQTALYTICSVRNPLTGGKKPIIRLPFVQELRTEM